MKVKEFTTKSGIGVQVSAEKFQSLKPLIKDYEVQM